MLRLLTIFLSIALLGNAGAAVSGLYTYEINADGVTITDYPTSATGALVIPDSLDGRIVTSIGYYAFESCNSLTSIIIPNSVTSIGDYAFRDCSSLTSVNIPDSVTSIGDEAFSGTNLTYSSVDGVKYLFSDSYAFLIDGSIASGDLSLPSDVGGKPIRVIADFAFQSCGGLTSIIIPDSVISIGSSAFQDCSSLTSVNIPDSVTSIGDYAFYRCTGLTSITIPDSVTSIGFQAFYQCTSLTSATIGNSVTSIGFYAFSSCTGLASINIPDSVTSIGFKAFYNCSSLTSINIPDSVTSIGGYAFSGTNLTYSSVDEVEYLFSDSYAFLIDGSSAGGGLSLPSNVDSKPVRLISDYAFRGSSLISITIPDSVTSIGDSTFSNCSSLTSVTIPDSVTSIGSSAFSYCTSLTSIIIPDSVISIGSSAFNNCTRLTSATIGNSVTSIGGYAFYQCTSLTSINIPDSVTSIGFKAFYNCSSLTSINIPDSVTSIGGYAFSGTNLTYSSVDEVEYLFSDSYAFLIDGSSAGGGLSLPSNVDSKPVRLISDYAFRGSSLISITIPNSVTSIGQNAFEICNSLVSIRFQSMAAPTIGSNAFSDIQSDAIIQYPSGATGYVAFYYDNVLIQEAQPGEFGLYTYSINADDVSVTITDYPTNATGALVIPVSMDGRIVTSIGGYAFQNCTGLTSIIIGNSVTNIGSNTFYNCTSLTSIIIGNSVTSIGQNAFRDCSKLASIIIPDSVTSMGDYAFLDCTSLTSATIGNSVTRIGDGAFYNCTGLASINIGNSVTSIGQNAFYQCSSLVAITFEGAPPAFNIDTLTNTSSEPILYYKSYPEAYNVYKETYNLPLVYLGPPNIQVQPQGAIASLAETINLSVAATDVQGSTLTYQWMRNGVDLIEKTAASLSITSLTATDTGSYQVKVSNSEGTTTSEAAAVTIVASQLYSQEQFDSALSSGFNLGVQSVSNNAQAYGLYTSTELIDLRTGSSQLQIGNNGAVMLQLQIQRSENLSDWSTDPEDLIEVELPMQQGQEFYRFAMPQ